MRCVPRQSHGNAPQSRPGATRRPRRTSTAARKQPMADQRLQGGGYGSARWSTLQFFRCAWADEWTTASFCRHRLPGGRHPCRRSPASFPLARCESLKAHDGIHELLALLTEFRQNRTDVHNGKVLYRNSGAHIDMLKANCVNLHTRSLRVAAACARRIDPNHDLVEHTPLSRCFPGESLRHYPRTRRFGGLVAFGDRPGPLRMPTMRSRARILPLSSSSCLRSCLMMGRRCPLISSTVAGLSPQRP
jgi:hypothetical protein